MKRMSTQLNFLPGLRWLARLPRQLMMRSPFSGDIQPSRIPLFLGTSRRGVLPFPHPWNYGEPPRILESCYWRAETLAGSGKHNCYLEFPGIAPILMSRDPQLIRAIATETGDGEGQFDRDKLPAVGIAYGTGKDMLLYANGAAWKRQRRIAAAPFGKTTLFQVEQFHEFEETFRHTVRQRLAALQQFVERTVAPARVELEPEIKVIMLEMLTNNFFGAEISYDELRHRYVPAMERIIQRMVRDTVINLGFPSRKLPRFTRGIAQARDDYAAFEQLIDLALAPRQEGRGLWRQFKSDVPDAALRSNLKLVLAGALEATTAYASWAIAHLARNLPAQEKAFAEVRDVESYTPESLDGATYLGNVLNETLRLTPPLYFLPRQASVDTWVETADHRKLFIPKGTHVFLDLWNANRHEDHWGVSMTGFPASEFVPERWDNLKKQGRGSKDFLHFGFGHGPRVCPGKHLGQLEVGLVVGAFLKLFRFKAVQLDNSATAAISTKPRDNVLVELEPRPV